MALIAIFDRPAAANNWASGEYAAGKRYRKVGAILHWMVGYLPGTTSMFQNPGTGYATSLGIGTANGRDDLPVEAHRYVPSDGRSYGSYNPYADGLCESIEIQNNWPNPASTPSNKLHQGTAQLLAQLAIAEDWRIGGKIQLVLGDFPDHRYYQRDIPGLGVDFNIMTHRSMALKDCPGTTAVMDIVAEGNRLIREMLGGSTTASLEDDMSIKDLFVPFKKAKGQNIKGDGTSVHLHINDKGWVSVSAGPHESVRGNLQIQVSGGKPYASSFKVTPVVNTVNAKGDITASTSLGAREIIFTDGDTLGEVSVDCALAKNQKLAFKIGGSNQNFHVESAVFRGAELN